MKNSEIPEVHKSILKETAKKLNGAERREYIAMITIKLLDGNARKAESVFGWGRATVKKGMRELATGIKCIDNYSLRGNKKTEEKISQLAEDIRAIVDPKSQADPHFQTTFAYTRITAKAVRKALINEKEYTDDELPCENTMGVILNRLDYRLKRMDKTRLLLRLVYYPPYHSKYNSIERCWGILEEHWNGTILSSIDKAIKWTGTMTWKGVHPVVHLLDKVYQKGVKLKKEAMKIYEERIKRLENLPKWDVTIKPTFW